MDDSHSSSSAKALTLTRGKGKGYPAHPALPCSAHYLNLTWSLLAIHSNLGLVIAHSAYTSLLAIRCTNKSTADKISRT